MEKKTKARKNNTLAKSSNRAGNNALAHKELLFEKQLGPLMQVIDDAVSEIGDERKRQEARQLVGEAIHGAMRQLVARPTQPRSLPASVGVSSQAVTTAVDAVKSVQNLGFVEFTTGLINGTFDAIIAATIKQMDAYAKLVADLAKTLDQFQAENVSDAQINAHLAGHYPDGAGNTTVRSNYTFTDTPENLAQGTSAKSGHEKLVEVAKALENETVGLPEPLLFVFLDAEDPTPEPLETKHIRHDAVSFTADQVRLIRGKMGHLLAKGMLEHLRAMAREGMARIVIDKGTLTSKLTFQVNATSEQTTQADTYSRHAARVGVRGGFVSGLFGAQFGASYSGLSVSTVNQNTYDAVTMSAEIIGQVSLNFRTETFPPIVTDGGAKR
jgi:hypothetical protein